MKFHSGILKKIWYDPVFSNLIANGIMALIIYFFYKLTSHPVSPEKIPENPPSLTLIPDIQTKPFHPLFLETKWGTYLIYAGYFILFGLLLVFVFRMVKGILEKSRKNR